MSATLPNLTTTWLAHRAAQGESKASALRWLNERRDTAYSSSRLNEWLRGIRHPDRATRITMMRDLLPAALGRLGVPSLTPDHLDDLAEAWT